MGRTTTPKYIVVFGTPGYMTTPAPWRVYNKKYDKPTAENLVKHVAAFTASMQPGGPNAHLNNPAKPYRVAYAAIHLNDGTYNKPEAHPLAEIKLTEGGTVLYPTFDANGKKIFVSVPA